MNNRSQDPNAQALLPTPDAPGGLTSSTAVVNVEPVSRIEPSITHLGPYVLDRQLGRGAMGTVYEATHTKLKRQVALKILPTVFSWEPQRLARFMREMEAIGRLDHPNIVRATDAGEIDNIHYLVMELVDGVDLHQLVTCHGRVDYGTACEIIRQAASGLQHIHEHQFVHRDIKPSNIMVASSGMVKILDLGIARLRQGDELGTLTSFKGVMGTPDFMAPEQALETGSVDIRADIYSLGCTFYKLLTGKAPFDGPEYGTQVAKIMAHGSDEPTAVDSLVSEIPPGLVDVLRRMMAKKADDRYQTPSEVANLVHEWSDASRLEQLVAASAAQVDTVRHRKPVTRRRQFSVGTRNVAPKPVYMWTGWTAVTVGIALLLAWGVAPHSPEPPAKNLEGAAYVEGHATHQALLEGTGQQLAQPLREVAENTRQISDATQEFATTGQEINRNTRRIADTLDELRDAFLAADRQGGIVADPASTGELYHNARVYARQGKNQLARASYLRILQSGTDFVDVHRSFQRFLITQEGTAGVRDVYSRLPASYVSSTVHQWAVSLLQDSPERQKRLTAIIRDDPTFAPAVYELSRCWSQARQGSQTLTEMAREKELLERFLRLHEEGHLLRHFLDQSEATIMLDDARQRLVEVSAVNPTVFEHPVNVSLSKHRLGWSIILQVVEPAREILYRWNPQESFNSTGLTNQIDPRTGYPAPRTYILAPPTIAAGTIEVKYIDVRDNECGPFTLPINPERDSIRSNKLRLDATKHAWVSFGRGENADKLYFTHLAPYKDILAEVRYGLDQDKPTRVHPLPDVAHGDVSRLFVPVPKMVKFVVVQLAFSDGTASDVVRIDRPRP